MYKGKFITFEGPDGAGKTSVMQSVADYFRKKNQYTIMMTREPGGNPIAEQIRNIILDVNHTAMDARTEALLFAAARRQHLVEKVLPALSEGQLVLCDRFVDSSLVYQGVARRLPVEQVWQINQFAIENYLPDLTLVLDVPAEVGLARIYANRSDEVNRLDRESVEFHHLVRQAFLDLAAKEERMIVIDATQPLEAVVAQCIQIIESNL
ncbi:dTMP kinase [Aerococcaceae bacterium NML210727]|nr:dTMP kinase [Aerococcaceae bacterium NML210727]MCW6654461.1 dTMP kinase [Aerococcaceae bacterium NML201296]MCW6662008.1 dTMP kinase [Aerococcaceae bacterium NML201209]MCW6682834.1 dTMP kinase [Aerococcaceae bacterium NML160702]